MTRQTCLDSDDASAARASFHSPTQQQHGDTNFRESVVQVRKRVLQAVRRRDYCRAIAILNRLLSSYPNSAADYSNRGLVYLWSNQPRKALVDFNRAIELDPSLASSYNNRANYYASQGARESAIEDYDQAIDLNPFNVRARINRAATLRELRRYDAALDGLDEALIFRQLPGEIYAERGRTYHLRGDWNSAIADYQRALQILNKARSKAAAPSSRCRQIADWLTQLQSPIQLGS